MVTDTIDGVLIEEDEDGFYMIMSGGKAEYRFNIHAVADEVLKSAWRTIAPWVLEGEQVKAEFRTKSGRVLTEAEIQELADEAEEGYDIRDFKRRDPDLLSDYGPGV